MRPASGRRRAIAMTSASWTSSAHVVGDRPADDPSGVGVLNGDEVEPAFPGAQVGDVSHPQQVRGCRPELPVDEIIGDPNAGPPAARAGQLPVLAAVDPRERIAFVEVSADRLARFAPGGVVLIHQHARHKRCDRPVETEPGERRLERRDQEEPQRGLRLRDAPVERNRRHDLACQVVLRQEVPDLGAAPCVTTTSYPSATTSAIWSAARSAASSCASGSVWPGVAIALPPSAITTRSGVSPRAPAKGLAYVADEWRAPAAAANSRYSGCLQVLCADRPG